MYRLLEEVFLIEASQVKVVNNVMTLSSVFQKGNEPNANKRIYPIEYLRREVDRLKPIVQARALVGELDHPFYPDMNESSIIHMGNASHGITKLWYEGTLVLGQIEVLDTPSGIILQEFMKKKFQVGVSSRSLGDVVDGADGFQYVDDSLKIITWDSVLGPSVVESKLKLMEAMNQWKAVKATEDKLKQQLLEQKKAIEDKDYIRKMVKDIIEKELNYPK